MARRKTVALSEEEHSRLLQYRENNYEEGVPLGVVIGNLMEESE